MDTNGSKLQLLILKKLFDIPINSIPAPHIKKTSHDITCEIKKLIKNNILGNVPPIDLEDFLGTEDLKNLTS